MLSLEGLEGIVAGSGGNTRESTLRGSSLDAASNNRTSDLSRGRANQRGHLGSDEASRHLEYGVVCEESGGEASQSLEKKRKDKGGELVCVLCVFGAGASNFKQEGRRKIFLETGGVVRVAWFAGQQSMSELDFDGPKGDLREEQYPFLLSRFDWV